MLLQRSRTVWEPYYGAWYGASAACAMTTLFCWQTLFRTMPIICELFFVVSRTRAWSLPRRHIYFSRNKCTGSDVYFRRMVELQLHICAIIHWPISWSSKDVWSFLSLTTYCRRCVENFENIAKPHDVLSERNYDVPLVPSMWNGFWQIKNSNDVPTVAWFFANWWFILDTDAINLEAGSLLSENQYDKERLIAYYNMAFRKLKQNYYTVRHELPPTNKPLNHFYQYLYGHMLLIWTDHEPLTWLL